MDPKVNDDFHKWLEKTYGRDDIGHVEASRTKNIQVFGDEFGLYQRNKNFEDWYEEVTRCNDYWIT